MVFRVFRFSRFALWGVVSRMQYNGGDGKRQERRISGNNVTVRELRCLPIKWCEKCIVLTRDWSGDDRPPLEEVSDPA